MGLLYVIITITIFTFSITRGQRHYDPEALTAFIRDRANESITSPRTGTSYDISLPTNSTGMRASFVRLRRGSLRSRGANLGSLTIPPNVVPSRQAKRLAVVYEDLGNWSSSYYTVPNHSLVAPVVGFAVYDSPGVSLVAERVNLTVRGRPISIRFDGVGIENDTVPRCVSFWDDGGFEIKGTPHDNACATTRQGRFSIVVPSGAVKRKGKRRYLRWWLVGFGGGFVGIVFFVLGIFGISRWVKRKRLRAMERQSQNGVSFGTFAVGSSAKLPSASMIRTQPTVEDVYVL